MTRKKKSDKESFTYHLTWLRKKMAILNKERVYEAAMDEDCSADAVKDSYITAKEALEVVGIYVFGIDILDTPTENPVVPNE